MRQIQPEQVPSQPGADRRGVVGRPLPGQGFFGTMTARAAPCNPLRPSRLLPLPRRTEHGVKFLCDRCKTRYSIGDDRVRGKILKIRCKNCGNVITVREGMAPELDAELAGRPKKSTTGAPD